MTRRAVYYAALAAVVGATAMAVASVVAPNWISFAVTPRSGDVVFDRIGLRRRCTSTSTAAVGGCAPFPDPVRCKGDGVFFCDLWRTAGHLALVALAVDMLALASFVMVMAGGRSKRESGWRGLCVMLLGAAALHFGAMAVVGYLFDNDELFHVPGYMLDKSWYFSMASGALAILAASGLAISALVLPPEEGSIFLSDSTDV